MMPLSERQRRRRFRRSSRATAANDDGGGDGGLDRLLPGDWQPRAGLGRGTRKRGPIRRTALTGDSSSAVRWTRWIQRHDGGDELNGDSVDEGIVTTATTRTVFLESGDGERHHRAGDREVAGDIIVVHNDGDSSSSLETMGG